MTRLYFMLALSLAAAACTTESDRGMVILHNQFLDATCEVPATAGGTARVAGVLDAGAPRGYVFTPVLQSLVAESDTRERLIVIEGANVSVANEDGTAVANGDFSTRFATSVAPGGTAGLAFEITPSEMAKGRYLSTVVVFGTLEGSSIESEPFTYPIEVVDFADRPFNLGPCSALDEGYQGTFFGTACSPYQDGGIECCTDGIELVCPAEGPPPA